MMSFDRLFDNGNYPDPFEERILDLWWLLKERLCVLKSGGHETTMDGWCRKCLKWLPDQPPSWLTHMAWLRDRGIGPVADDMGRIPVSNSQLRRWLDSGSILLNGKKPKADEPSDEEVIQLTYFPGGKRQISVF